MTGIQSAPGAGATESSCPGRRTWGKVRAPLAVAPASGQRSNGAWPHDLSNGGIQQPDLRPGRGWQPGTEDERGRLHSRIGVAGIKGNQVPAQELMPAILPPVAFAVEGPPTAAEWCCSHQAELAWGMEQKVRSPWPARDPAGSLTGLIRSCRHSCPSNQSTFRLGAYPTFPFCHFHPV